MKLLKLDKKGRITIDIDTRKLFNINPGDRLIVEVIADCIQIRKQKNFFGDDFL